MLGREFQVLGAVQQKAHPKKVVLWKVMNNNRTFKVLKF